MAKPLSAAADLDGTIVSYGDGAVRFNPSFTLSLARAGDKVINIITNQGGLVFGLRTAAQVAERLRVATEGLAAAGVKVNAVYICTAHPKASAEKCEAAAAQLRELLPNAHVFSGIEYRKPNAAMLVAAKATKYYGDSDEDAAAARNAGIPYVKIERFA